mgnify:CR=1 FL=1
MSRWYYLKVMAYSRECQFGREGRSPRKFGSNPAVVAKWLDGEKRTQVNQLWMTFNSGGLYCVVALTTKCAWAVVVREPRPPGSLPALAPARAHSPTLLPSEGMSC